MYARTLQWLDWATFGLGGRGRLAALLISAACLGVTQSILMDFALLRSSGTPAIGALISGSVVFGLALGLIILAGSRIAQRHLDEMTSSEERFAVMADTVPDILFAAEARGSCTYVNQRFGDFTGIPATSALCFGWMAAVHPQDTNRVRRVLQERVNDDGLAVSEIRLRGKDGRYRWFLARLRPVRDRKGAVIKWFGSATDIDHVKRAEDALRGANAQLSAVLDGIDECYCTLDHESRVTYLNQNAAAWLDLEPSRVIGRKLWEVVPSLMRSDLAILLQDAIRRHAPLQLERRSDVKPERWIEVHSYPSSGGQSVFFRDITDRKAVEQALLRTQGLLQGTMDALSAQIVVLDEHGVIVAANAAWRRTGREFAGAAYGLGAHYLAACEGVLDPSDFAAMARGLRSVIEGEQREFLMHYLRRHGGEVRWLQMRATRLDRLGRHIVVAHEDVTDVKRAEAGLKELAGRVLAAQDQERRRIARDLHDTTAQNLVAALMSMDCMGQQNGVRRSDGMMDEVRSLVERSVHELRTLSYLLHPPLLEEQGLVSALTWFIRGFEKRSGIQVEFRILEDARRPPAEVETAIFRIVQEALTNVHRHSGSATAVVWLAQGEDEALLEVSDRGCGMRDENESGSLGVGISGMRVRVQQLGGTLDLRSMPSGTLVRARIPVDPPRSPVGRIEPRRGREKLRVISNKAGMARRSGIHFDA